MKAKNSKERSGSFLKFFVLFVITVAMILVAVYFNFEIPEKENKLLREQVKVIKEDMEYQSDFFAEMQILKGMIDSLKVPGQNTSYQNTLISTKIVDLEKNVPPKSSSHVYDMHMAIIQLYIELQTATDKLQSLRDAEGTIAEYKEFYENCRDDLIEAERELYIARRSR
ncbi:type VI secretion system TssO [Eudoraea adriatica]|uniref:type VI secretion system TssO n=1 Tax=Eudoraea adriatica TaxID=446681 RepID=UPI00037B3958|nr:type VI secretion system TssO [Eudoraea adriatica]